MNQSLKNPFEDSKRPKYDDATMIGELLGEEAEAEMRKDLSGSMPTTKRTDMLDDSGEIVLTDQEQQAFQSTENKVDGEQRRQQYFDWADEAGVDEIFIDLVFDFDMNGDVDLKRDLDLSDQKGLKSIPPGLVTSTPRMMLLRGCAQLESIEGLPSETEDILLNGCESLTSLKGIPQLIHGDLVIKECAGLTDLKELVGVTIDKLLDLRKLLITTIPAGINVKVVKISKANAALVKDAQSKGYKVKYGK